MNLAFAESERQVQAFARRVHRRVRAAGITDIDYDDIEQECWIAWCRARDNYQPGHNVPFLAYLQRGMVTHINRWMKEFERYRGLAPRSINEPVRADDDAELHELLSADDDEEPVDFLQRDLALSLMTARTRTFVSLLLAPSPELYAQVDRIADRAEFGRKRGLDSAAPRRLTGKLVMDLMGCDRPEREAIYRELRGLAKEINQ